MSASLVSVSDRPSATSFHLSLRNSSIGFRASALCIEPSPWVLALPCLALRCRAWLSLAAPRLALPCPALPRLAQPCRAASYSRAGKYNQAFSFEAAGLPPLSPRGRSGPRAGPLEAAQRPFRGFLVEGWPKSPSPVPVGLQWTRRVSTLRMHPEAAQECRCGG
jgi:hypothetical protein